MDRSGTLLYDGDCGICLASARWLADRVPRERLGLLALREVATRPDLAGIVGHQDLSARVHFVRVDGELFAGAAAVLAVGHLVPGWRLYATLADNPIGLALLKPLYREIASHRRRLGRLLRLPEVCPLVTRTRSPD